METRILHPHEQNKSAVDLTICSTDITTSCNWERIGCPLGTSDHYPLIITLNVNCKIQYENCQKYNIKKADWTLFSHLIETEFNVNEL